jgi:spermidine synthase
MKNIYSQQKLFVTFIGAFCGYALFSFLSTKFSSDKIIGKEHYIYMLMCGFCVLGSLTLLELYKRSLQFISSLKLTNLTQELFLKYHGLTYLIFLASGLIFIGIKAYISFALLLAIIFVLSQIILLWLVSDKGQKERWLQSLDAVPMVFFISGFAALIYQVVWQRVLFSTFGSNIESVTVIVSVFMFGLGLGSLVGGKVQKHFPNHLLEYFIGVEIAIGLFGIFSIGFIEMVGELVPNDSLPSLVIASFSLLAFPTMLMGSTLPLLVSYLQRQNPNISAIVAKLYAYNTLGSAVASFLTVMLLFTVLGRQSTLIVASICNIVTAYLVWVICKNYNRNNIYQTDNNHIEKPQSVESYGISFGKIVICSGIIGYVSLSLEIIWFRIIGFMTANLPQIFGTLLAVFLTGIAYGALKAKKWSESGRNINNFINNSLVYMLATAYLSVPFIEFITRFDKDFGVLVGYIFVGLIAYFSGGIFPFLCQIGANASNKQAGTTVSWVYFFNIIGATLGSFITGFILFDIFTLEWNITIICLVIIFLYGILNKSHKTFYALGMIAVISIVFLQPVLYKDIIPKLQNVPSSNVVKYVNENKHGIITIIQSKKGDDLIFGNGAYDGRFNINPVLNSNQISRAYMIAALHPNPKRVLDIGLSGGAWAKVMTMYKPLDEVVSIEINPGYLDIMKNYPEISPIFQNPKWTYHIDDGRRWLKNNPNEKFDIIIMNTIYYWRSNSSSLLSREFLELCKKHLNEGGVIYYNSTEARDSFYTAAHVFKHVSQIQNMVVASDSPFSMTDEQKRSNLLEFINDKGERIFADENKDYRDVREKLVSHKLEDIRNQLIFEDNLWLITDDNMASEYKIEHSFLPPN